MVVKLSLCCVVKIEQWDTEKYTEYEDQAFCGQILCLFCNKVEIEKERGFVPE